MIFFKKSSDKRRRQSGQGLTEYVLLLAVVAGMGKILLKQMPTFLKSLEAPLKSQFALVYKYGDPKACGYEGDPPPCGGTPERHPRYPLQGSARMFARGGS